MILTEEDWMEFALEIAMLPNGEYSDMFKSEVLHLLKNKAMYKRCDRVGRQQRMEKRYRIAKEKGLL